MSRNIEQSKINQSVKSDGAFELEDRNKTPISSVLFKQMVNCTFRTAFDFSKKFAFIKESLPKFYVNDSTSVNLHELADKLFQLKPSYAVKRLSNYSSNDKFLNSPESLFQMLDSGINSSDSHLECHLCKNSEPTPFESDCDGELIIFNAKSSPNMVKCSTITEHPHIRVTSSENEIIGDMCFDSITSFWIRQCIKLINMRHQGEVQGSDPSALYPIPDTFLQLLGNLAFYTNEQKVFLSHVIAVANVYQRYPKKKFSELDKIKDLISFFKTPYVLTKYYCEEFFASFSPIGYPKLNLFFPILVNDAFIDVFGLHHPLALTGRVRNRKKLSQNYLQFNGKEWVPSDKNLEIHYPNGEISKAHGEIILRKTIAELDTKDPYSKWINYRDTIFQEHPFDMTFDTAKALSFTTPWRHSQSIFSWVKRISEFSTVIDCCAGLGGDSIQWSKHVSVSSYETNVARFECMSKNVNMYETKFPIMPFNDNALEAIIDQDLKDTLVYLDLPWGGSGYQKDKITKNLFLSYKGKNFGIIELADIVLKNGGIALFKLPFNIDQNLFESFSTIFRKRTKSLFVLVKSKAKKLINSNTELSSVLIDWNSTGRSFIEIDNGLSRLIVKTPWSIYYAENRKEIDFSSFGETELSKTSNNLKDFKLSKSDDSVFPFLRNYTSYVIPIFKSFSLESDIKGFLDGVIPLVRKRLSHSSNKIKVKYDKKETTKIDTKSKEEIIHDLKLKTADANEDEFFTKYVDTEEQISSLNDLNASEIPSSKFNFNNF